jgi:hypothetical protein
VEDELSCTDHIKSMHDQWHSGVHNNEVLTDKIKRTYTMRRAQVEKETLSKLLEIYPALHDVHQVNLKFKI